MIFLEDFFVFCKRKLVWFIEKLNNLLKTMCPYAYTVCVFVRLRMIQINISQRANVKPSNTHTHTHRPNASTKNNFIQRSTHVCYYRFIRLKCERQMDGKTGFGVFFLYSMVLLNNHTHIAHFAG